MSHWSQVKTTFKLKDVLIKSLKELFPEHRVIENSTVRGYAGRKVNADVILQSKGSARTHDVGFQLSGDGTYEMVADWWGAKHEFGEESSFHQRLNQTYAKNTVLRQARKFGYKTTQKVQEDGSIRLALRKY